MMADLAVPPGLFLILAGLVLPFLRGTARSVVILSAPLLLLIIIWSLPADYSPAVTWLGYELTPVRIDTLSRLFAIAFAIMAFAGGLFALNQENTAELAAAFVYGGAAIGVVFAGDLITVFIFWEVMAIGSTIVIWATGASAFAAGKRYAIIHIFGGVVLMAGIAGEITATGSLQFNAMSADSLARWLILAGFLVNAGAPPLSTWLPDAYPKASWSGTVFLSAFTTKTAVYVLMRGFPGTEILIYFGFYMMFYGIVYAILENDMRRILAYSIVNQVGFMIAGIGIGSEMALNGTASHAFAHIIYKALLLMSAGSVLYMTGKRKCTDLGGLFRTMPITTTCGIIGALSISAFPLTSGFISKSMISQAAADDQMLIIWLLLAAASAGVFLHAGIKFPWFVFFQKDSGLRPAEPPLNMRLAMYFMSFLCLALGVYPQPLYAILPYPVDYVPYTGEHVVFQLQLLLFSGLAFFLLLGMLRRTLTITLDVDWFWRGLGRALAEEFRWRGSLAWTGFVNRTCRTTRRFVEMLYRHGGPEGIFARTRPTGSMAFWTTVLLAAYLLFYYL
jgi:multicomponent Na+:H+ antiporter subunit D